MFDLWGFLLQTLSVSGIAALILFVKALFKDKLPPKWQFTVWGVLGLMMLIPTGIGGRYTLFRWQLFVEVIKSWVGEYRFTRVLFPIPVITAMPKTVTEWLFAVCVFGGILHIFMYVISYVKLRRFVRKGHEPCEETMHRIRTLALAQGIKLCRVVEISELPSAFVCGVFRPILVLPAGKVLDEKIVLHELFHLKNKDTLWSVMICLLRSLHWCNPLIVYCAKRALNDMESRCDQYVLETLEGEERREYGRVLLSMANERFSKTPGSTCINNGGKNIRERIENIARFKKYPQGMRLVSVCVLILLALPLAVGAKDASILELGNSVRLTLASARSTPCTTAAGAFDAYGKAILDRNGYYRAMCAPEGMQADILKEMLEKDRTGFYPMWDSGLEEWANAQRGYYVYNLRQVSDGAYEGLLVIELNYPPDGKAGEADMMYLAVQNLRVEKEKGRWVAIPLEDFRHVETFRLQSLAWGCRYLPAITYSGEACDMRLEVRYQTVHTVDSTVTDPNDDSLFGSSSFYDTTPKPDAEFTFAARGYSSKCTYIGNEAEKDAITHIAFSVAPVYSGEKRPEQLQLPNAENSKPIGDEMSGGSNTGEQWLSKKLSEGWDSEMELYEGGGSCDPTQALEHPQFYVADLYLNHEKVANLDLTLQKGEAE